MSLFGKKTKYRVGETVYVVGNDLRVQQLKVESISAHSSLEGTNYTYDLGDYRWTRAKEGLIYFSRDEAAHDATNRILAGGNTAIQAVVSGYEEDCRILKQRLLRELEEAMGAKNKLYELLRLAEKREKKSVK